MFTDDRSEEDAELLKKKLKLDFNISESETEDEDEDEAFQELTKITSDSDQSYQNWKGKQEANNIITTIINDLINHVIDTSSKENVKRKYNEIKSIAKQSRKKQKRFYDT